MKLIVHGKKPDRAGYLYLPTHPARNKKGIVKAVVDLAELIPNYKGPVIHLDFDESNVLIGIEILEWQSTQGRESSKQEKKKETFKKLGELEGLGFQV